MLKFADLSERPLTLNLTSIGIKLCCVTFRLRIANSDGGDAGDNKNGQPLSSTDYVPAAILST